MKRKAKLIRYCAHFSPKLLPHLSCHILFLQLSQVSLELANSRNARWLFHFSLVYSTRCRIVSLVVARFAQCIRLWMGGGVARVDLFSHTHFATLSPSQLSSLGSTFCPAQIPESARPDTAPHPLVPPSSFLIHPLGQHSVSFPAKFSLYIFFLHFFVSSAHKI